MPKLAPVASSFASRLGIFLLAALAIFNVPEVVRTIVRMRIEHDVSNSVIQGMALLAIVSGFVMIGGSTYAMWFAVFGKDDTP